VKTQLVRVRAPSGTSNDETDLLRLVIANDGAAWREMVQRYDGPLRTVVSDILQTTRGRPKADVDDVMGAFWLRMVEDDRRWLRAFNPAHGALLLNWLTLHVSQLAHERAGEVKRDRKRMVPLDEARQLPTQAVPPVAHRPSSTIDQAVRDAVREVVREEIRIALRELSADSPKPAGQTSDYLSIADACEVAKIHPATLRGWIREGRLRGHRAGRHHRVRRSELESFLGSLGSAEDFDLDAKARELSNG
jgi:excisionase family DNA binding protein